MLFNKIPGRGYILIAILIFAASNSVTQKLTELGTQYSIEGRNPISFCNVLFVGNICALLGLVIIYGREWNANSLSRLNLSDWLSLVIIAILSGALAPALIFFALDVTSVNNVILIGRIEPPLSLALSIFILKERVNLWTILGAVIAFTGVILTIVLQPSEVDPISMGGGFTIGRGELMAAVGAIALAIANIISKIKLTQIPLGIFTIFRTALGTVVFFVFVVKLYSLSHFIDVFAPIVWQWMLVYGAIIVVGGQLAWFQGLKTTNASDVSLANSISPIAGILAAYFILGEVPTAAQYIGGSVIILGIIANQIGVSERNTTPTNKTAAVWQKEMDEDVGFKGF